MKKSVTYEGVTFVVALCSQMSRAEFMKAHQCYWPDKDTKTRNKMLAEAYRLIAPAPEAEQEKN